MLEVRSSHPLTNLTGKWDGKGVAFWTDGNAKSTTRKPISIWRALVGIDLEQSPGKYDATVSAQGSNGNNLSCAAPVAVQAGHFATESLHVENQFVEPNPEQVARAKSEQQKLREIFATVTPEHLWNGPFRIPLDGVTSGTNFGRRRVLNGQPGSPHSGMDLPATTGTPVHAAQGGRVALAEALYFSGNTVVVDHGLGVYTLYGHLNSIAVKAGDTVAAGTLLGEVGATGRVTGPHLHWGLTVNRARVNPMDIVAILRSR